MHVSFLGDNYRVAFESPRSNFFGLAFDGPYYANPLFSDKYILATLQEKH